MLMIFASCWQFLDGPTAEISHDGEGDLKCRATDLQRYRVAGSAGSVIIATDTANGDTVAIKVRCYNVLNIF